MPHKVRSAVVLFLFLIFAAGAVHALPSSAPWEPAGFLEDLWFRFAARVTGFWEKEGAEMDPNGAPAGSMMDPNGAPNRAGTPPGEEGSMMDPNG